MIWILSFITPIFLIFLGLMVNRLGLSIPRKYLDVLKVCLALSGFLVLLKILLFSQDWGLFRWRWMNNYPALLFLILVVMVYALGKKHFKASEAKFYKGLQIIPIAFALLMLVPMLNLFVAAHLLHKPERYYEDSQLVIQEEFEGLMAMAKPPKIYEVKYGLFISEVALAKGCQSNTDSVTVEQEGTTYSIQMHGSWLESTEGNSQYQQSPCILKFDLDTL